MQENQHRVVQTSDVHMKRIKTVRPDINPKMQKANEEAIQKNGNVRKHKHNYSKSTHKQQEHIEYVRVHTNI